MLEEKEIIERDTPATPLNIIVVNGQCTGSCPKCGAIVYSSDELQQAITEYYLTK